MPELDHTINALIRKRAEIAGRLEYHLAEARKAEDDLASVDHTLAMFAAGIRPQEIKPKRFRPDAKPRGEVMRHILEALRTAKAPMTGAELAAVVLERRGLTAALRMSV